MQMAFAKYIYWKKQELTRIYSSKILLSSFVFFSYTIFVPSLMHSGLIFAISILISPFYSIVIISGKHSATNSKSSGVYNFN